MVNKWLILHSVKGPGQKPLVLMAIGLKRPPLSLRCRQCPVSTLLARVCPLVTLGAAAALLEVHNVSAARSQAARLRQWGTEGSLGKRVLLQRLETSMENSLKRRRSKLCD